MAGNRRKLSFLQRCGAAISAVGAGIVRRRRAIVIGFVTALAGWGVFETTRILGSTRHFVLKTVEVTGCERLDPSEVENACGLVIGKTELFSMITPLVERRCREDARLEWVDVRKVLPDRLRISVREARPAVLVSMNGGLTAFDSLGRELPDVDTDWAAGLPLIEGMEHLFEPVSIRPEPDEADWQKSARARREKRQNDDRRARIESTVLDALRLVASMESAQPEWTAGGVLLNWSPAVGFTLKMPTRPTVVFGLPPFEVKVERLGRAVEVASARGLNVEEIFLDNESNPGSVTLRCHEASPGDGDLRAWSRLDSVER